MMYTRRYTVTTEVYTYTYYMYTVCMCLKDIHVHTFYSPLLVGVQGSVRLVDGPSDLEGRVEVCNNQEWGTVCQTFWESPDAGIVCSQIGYSRFGALISRPSEELVYR